MKPEAVHCPNEFVKEKLNLHMPKQWQPRDRASPVKARGDQDIILKVFRMFKVFCLFTFCRTKPQNLEIFRLGINN